MYGLGRLEDKAALGFLACASGSNLRHSDPTNLRRVDPAITQECLTSTLGCTSGISVAKHIPHVLKRCGMRAMLMTEGTT